MYKYQKKSGIGKKIQEKIKQYLDEGKIDQIEQVNK